MANPGLQNLLRRFEGDPDANVFDEAVKRGDLEAVKAMLKRNPNLVFCESIFKTTSLQVAAANGLKAMAELLLAKGADINARNIDGRTSLHWAAVNGRKDVVELLLANGADANAKTNGGMTPIALAKDDPAYPDLTERRRAVVELLRQHVSQ